MITVTDALGRDVRELGTCARCGASIKYIFEFEGQTYGSSCIEAVSGIKPKEWEWKKGKPSLEATKAAKAKKEQERKEFLAHMEQAQKQSEEVKAHNAQKYEELINVLNNASRYNGDFCSSMAQDILKATVSTQLYEGILSPNQFEIVREIWGKWVGGRKNSKAYKAAVAEFDEKFDEESEE